MDETEEPTNFSQIIIDGFGEDCEFLMNQYLEKNTIRLKEFFELWKSNKFDLVYSGKKSLNELYEFTDEIFVYTGNLLFSSTTHQFTITSLYLIYCLWHSRPPGSVPSIRVTPNKVHILCELQKLVRDEEHYDILYVLCSLLRDGVFRFVISERDYGLEAYYKKYLIENTEKQKSEPSDVRELKELLNPENDVNLLEIMSLCEEYNDAKKDLEGENVTKKNLNMTNFQKLYEMQESLKDVDEQSIKNNRKDKKVRSPSSVQKKKSKNVPSTSKLPSDESRNVFFDYKET